MKTNESAFIFRPGWPAAGNHRPALMGHSDMWEGNPWQRVTTPRALGRQSEMWEGNPRSAAGNHPPALGRRPLLNQEGSPWCESVGSLLRAGEWVTTCLENACGCHDVYEK